MGAKISRELQRSEHTEQHFEEDYDHRVVRKLIRTGRLAPCFNGLSELPATTDESSRITVHKYPFLPWDLPNLRSTAAGALLQADSGQVVECPICLLYYPIHINYSRCCNQPICTECFLQMKRSTKTPLRPASCPFCVKPDFGVIYVPPPFSSQHKHVAKQRQKSLLDGRGSSGRRKNYAWDDPNVVLVDEIRPNWHMLMARGPEKTLSGVGTTRRRLVRPNEDAPRSGRIRAWDSPYYERTTALQDWSADENAAVMGAIREFSNDVSSTSSVAAVATVASHHSNPVACV